MRIDHLSSDGGTTSTTNIARHVFLDKHGITFWITSLILMDSREKIVSYIRIYLPF